MTAGDDSRLGEGAGRVPVDITLPPGFYARGTVEVARDLLGCRLVHDRKGIMRHGTIVETEAYVGADDRACHAARGGSGGRARVMYSGPGTVYVYLVYGMHWCLNAVTEQAGFPAAVLIRALEVIDGPNRAASGPGLVCRYMGIDGSANGAALTDGSLRIEPRIAKQRPIESGPRIGVAYAGAWAERPWRFWLTDSSAVSTRRRRTRASARAS